MRDLDNPELFTEEDKEANKVAAYTTYADTDPDTRAFSYATHVTYIVEGYDVEHWLKRYFKSTGEDRQVYIDEVERLRG